MSSAMRFQGQNHPNPQPIDAIALPWPILSESEGEQRLKASRRIPRIWPLPSRFREFSRRTAVLPWRLMRDGRFYKFYVYIMGSRTGSLTTPFAFFFPK